MSGAIVPALGKDWVWDQSGVRASPEEVQDE